MSWPKFWCKTTWQTRLLKPISLVVCKVARNRWLRFKQRRQSAVRDTSLLKVCVVGNIVIGGSGKTPFIIWLVRRLKQQGIKVGIVSRGYGGKSRVWPQAVTADSDPKLVGDEPVLLAKTLAVPVAVSPKRQQAVEFLSSTTDCDWLISDDGLQHYPMDRQLELVVIDSQRLFGNRLCLPAGPLREPLEKLSEVDARILNGEDHGNDFQTVLDQHEISPKPEGRMLLQPVCLRNLLDPDRTLPVNILAKSRIHAIAGIGNPQRFFQSLRDLGAEVKARAFADHFDYQAKDLQDYLSDSLQRENENSLENALIMTEKDAVKCSPIAKHYQAENWWYLEISPQVDESILDLIIKKMSASN